MPAAGKQNTRKRQRKSKPKLVPHGPGGQSLRPAPKPRVKPRPSNNAQTYVSQGKAVEKVANRQKAKAKKRQLSEPGRQYVSTGKAVEKRAKELGRQTARQRKFGADKPKTHIREGLKRELEGKGVLAKTLSKIGDSAGYTSTGTGSGLALGAAKRASGGSFARGSAAIAAPRVVPLKDAKGFGRASQDLLNYPAVALSSVYVPAAGVVEAAQGKPKRLKRFVKDFKKTDPIYNTGAAVVEKVKGNDAAARAHLKRAGKSASEHPGFTALEVAGAKGTVGRAVGRVVKAPHRPSATLEGTNLAEKRTYSPDAIKRQREKAVDKVQTKRAARLREKADRATTDEDASALRRRANRVDPTKVTAKQVRRRVDERVAANEDVRRINRTQVTRDVEEAVKPAKRGGAALSLVAQRITRADKEDLRAYRDEIAAHFDDLPKSGKRANRQLRKAIDDVLKDPKADMGKVQAASRRYEEITAPLQKKLSDRGLLADGQADKAKLIPYAVRRMGATHDKEKGLVVRKKVSRVVTEKSDTTPAPKLADRKEYIANRPKADPRDTPTVESLTQNVRPGEPGIHIEDTYIRLVDRDGNFAGFSDRRVPGYRDKVVVARDESGKPIGALKIIVNKDGKADLVEVAVDPAHRGKGLASQLYASAEKAGLEVEAASGRGGLTEAGAALKHKRLTKRAQAKPKKTTRRVETEEERPLGPRAIRAHMRAHGETEPAFLTQAPNMRGAKNFYMASDKAPSLRAARRTGEATRKGTFDAHLDTLKENAARAQGLADATDGFSNFIKEFGHRDGGKLRTFRTKNEADAAIRERQATDKGGPSGELELRAVRVNPWAGSKAQLQHLLDEVDSDSPTAHKAVADVISDAVKEGADGDGPWALVPKAAADQLAKHMRVTGPTALGRGAQLVNSSFRKTVLSTSPSWLVGNVAEAVGRAAVAKAGPRSYLTGKRTLKQLERIDPDAAKEATVRAAGGGHYSMADKAPRRDHTQFEDSRLEGLARKAGTFWRTPGPKQAADAWHAWTDLVFNHINRRIESKFQTAMLGKAIRDSNLMDGQTLKTGQKAVEQAAQGLRNTNEQVAFGRAVDRMYGKYNKFSPEGRMALALYTPFVAWTLNAVRFVADVLPRDHPTVTALIAASEIASEEWRKDHGLDLFIDNRVPAFLQGSIPMSGGRKFRASRYTPFGAFGSPLETATGAMLPQLSGVLAAGKGEDWKGAKLRVNGKEANELQRWGFATKAFAEATIPVLAVGERVASKGPSALNPVHPVSPKKKKPRGRPSSGGTWGDQGSGGTWGDQSSGGSWGG